MFIDFEKITTTTIANFRGGEKEFNAKIYNDAVNKIMQVTLVPGASIGMHKHEQESEIVYVLQGTGKAIYDTSEEEEEIDIEEVIARISERELELADSKEKLNSYLEQLGFERI